MRERGSTLLDAPFDLSVGLRNPSQLYKSLNLLFKSVPWVVSLCCCICNYPESSQIISSVSKETGFPQYILYDTDISYVDEDKVIWIYFQVP